MSICLVPHACIGYGGYKRDRESNRELLYRQLWATKRVLKIKPRFSGRVASTNIYFSISQSLTITFNKIYWICKQTFKAHFNQVFNQNFPKVQYICNPVSVTKLNRVMVVVVFLQLEIIKNFFQMEFISGMQHSDISQCKGSYQ